MASPRQSWPRANDEKNEIFLGAIREAWKTGFTAGYGHNVPDYDESEILEAMENKIMELDLWAFDRRDETPAKKVKKNSPAKKGEKKVSPKKPEMTNDLADFKNYNPTCCKARQWNKKDEGDFGEEQPGHGMQCWRGISHDGYCDKCAERMSDPDQDNWGDFDKPLKESPGHKANGGSHPWKAMKKSKVDKPKKEKKPKEDKPKKEKKPKKAKKPKKEKKPVEPEVEVVVEKVVEEIVEGAAKGAEEPANPVEEEPIPEEEEEKTQEMDDELGEDNTPEMVEYDANGFTVLWNKTTNQLLDPDDGELMGNMVADENGEWKPIMKEDDDSEDEESDSDSESE